MLKNVTSVYTLKFEDEDNIIYFCNAEVLDSNERTIFMKISGDSFDPDYPLFCELGRNGSFFWFINITGEEMTPLDDPYSMEDTIDQLYELSFSEEEVEEIAAVIRYTAAAHWYSSSAYNRTSCYCRTSPDHELPF